MKKKYPILEFDSKSRSMIDPSVFIKNRVKHERCVITFFRNALSDVVKRYNGTVIDSRCSEAGVLPVYQIIYKRKKISLFFPGIGAPMAGGFFDELIALGFTKFIACGGAGVLDKKLCAGHIVVPVSAVRDEGTSYHYMPPSREVDAGKKGVEAIEKVLKRHKAEYVLGKTWTTDGIYRETINKIKKRRKEGCLTVEMEAAAFFAIAKFRGVEFAQMLYCGDDLSGEEWDSRGWQNNTTVREKLLYLSIEACLEI